MDKEKLISADPQLFILYDGVCNFCISIIGLVSRLDKSKSLQAVPIQSKEGRNILRLRNEKFISLKTVYFIHDKRVYKKSTAIFKIFTHLPFPWKIISWFQILPVSFTDSVYRIIARYRYSLFGKQAQVIERT